MIFRPRLLVSTALTLALIAGPIAPDIVRAQPAPPPAAPNVTTPATSADAPERVGRLARVSGSVSFRNQGDTDWSPAVANYPVASGAAFWTQPGAGADLEFSGSHLAMAGGTEVDVEALDGAGLRATIPQGEAFLRLSHLAPGETWSVQTPRGLAILDRDGRYGIATGDGGAPTIVTVIEGAAQIAGPGVALSVGPGQAASITGGDILQGVVEPARPDAFLTGWLSRDQPPPPPRVPPPPSVAAMPGGEDLYRTGMWDQAPEYGPVWYPPVQPGWVPYRDGHWAYVAPWGWTWIDDAPWGFAPFHYGRWVDTGGRWAWIPGYAAPGPAYPVYAPALVTFFGIGAGAVVGIGIGAALAQRSIGWLPLGPREPYRPWYRASPRYERAININHVNNYTTINRTMTINNFANHRGATVVPTGTLTGSRPVHAAAQPFSHATLATARPMIGQPPARPTAATAGMTPSVARQMNLPGGFAHQPAPGPAMHPRPQAGSFAGPGQPGMGQQGAGQGASPGAGQRAAQPGGGFQPGAGFQARPSAPAVERPAPQNTAPPGFPGQQRSVQPGSGPRAAAPPAAPPPATPQVQRPAAPMAPHPGPFATPAPQMARPVSPPSMPAPSMPQFQSHPAPSFQPQTPPHFQPAPAPHAQPPAAAHFQAPPRSSGPPPPPSRDKRPGER